MVSDACCVLSQFKSRSHQDLIEHPEGEPCSYPRAPLIKAAIVWYTERENHLPSGHLIPVKTEIVSLVLPRELHNCSTTSI